MNSHPLQANAALISLLVLAIIALSGEARHAIKEWMIDWRLRRYLSRRRLTLREGWSSEGSERLRGRLADAQDTLKRGNKP